MCICAVTWKQKQKQNLLLYIIMPLDGRKAPIKFHWWAFMCCIIIIIIIENTCSGGNVSLLYYFFSKLPCFCSVSLFFSTSIVPRSTCLMNPSFYWLENDVTFDHRHWNRLPPLKRDQPQSWNILLNVQKPWGSRQSPCPPYRDVPKH